ncbi:hypothetical protein MD484_g8171, partial [Candolleomyces efflorescens]
MADESSPNAAESLPSPEVNAPAAIIVGQRVLTNALYGDRAADLDRGELNAYLIGWKHNGRHNQIFNFEPQGGSTCKILTTGIDIPRLGRVFEVSSPDPAPGTELRATIGGVGSVYTVIAHAPELYKLSILSAGGTAPLYWTLNSEEAGTRITLELDNGTSNQVWGIVTPDEVDGDVHERRGS